MTRALLLLAAPIAALAIACGSSTTPDQDAGPDETDAGITDAGPDAKKPDYAFECPKGSGVSPSSAGCPDFIPGSMGDCQTTSWHGFENGSCHPVATCGPAAPPLPASLFEDLATCAVTCGAADKCDLTKKLGGPLNLDKPLEGQLCDDVEIQTSGFDDALLAQLCGIAPDLHCTQEDGGPMHCFFAGGALTAAQTKSLCALSLVQKVDVLWCWVYL
ncbi:hypothetical protein A7982_13027 [Minicystis rosea]|nr:hypothetical protein A7982_13027 [Minicystis rosea]